MSVLRADAFQLRAVDSSGTQGLNAWECRVVRCEDLLLENVSTQLHRHEIENIERFVRRDERVANPLGIEDDPVLLVSVQIIVAVSSA